MSEQFRIFSFAVLVSVFSTPFVLAADDNSGVREIGDSVYSFTPSEEEAMAGCTRTHIVLVNGSLDRLVDFVDGDTCTEHNPRLGDGVSN